MLKLMEQGKMNFTLDLKMRSRCGWWGWWEVSKLMEQGKTNFTLDLKMRSRRGGGGSGKCRN